MAVQAVPYDHSQGWIAYTSDRGGAFDIWLYRPQDGLNFQLTKGLGEEFSIPYWSPDSRRIAFIGMGNAVYLLDTATLAAARIDQIEPYTLLDWSPDSRSLVYVNNGQIVVYDTFSHRSYAIPQPGASDVQWFPSGKELLFAAPDSTGLTQLFRIRADGTDRRQITHNTDGPLHDVRISPDGTFALFTFPGASISIISTVDLATGTIYTLEGGPLAKNYFPAWSPDSRSIAYSATAYKEPNYYSLIQTDSRTGQNQRTLAASSCFATPVSWSPDGDQIAYLSGCTGSESASQLWIADLREPVPVNVLSGGRITALQWSPRVRRIPENIYTSFVYRVSFPYPAYWRRVSEERYEGAGGFFQVSAISAGGRIADVCNSEAFHPLLPYGSSPRIVMMTIQNREACFIIPSADQPAEMNKQAALIVRYPRPVQIGGTSYNYFILWADVSHILQMGRRLSFI
ncbi:TolB protein [Paenibacillus jilunlii]|uniref:TolB protein n=1 Tax=Paenibacillus jilunlii TaxID=682956 RepID=A0A1G9QX06_9BACL|nr:TolB protein [Paenibacillus jilunlii]